MKFETSGNISEELVVTTSAQWLEKQGINPEYYDWAHPMIELVGRMIALDAAIFMQRRTAYLCGSNVDYLRSIHRDLQAEYHKLTGELWDLKDYNKNIDW